MMFLAVLSDLGIVGITFLLILLLARLGPRLDKAEIRSALAKLGATLVEISRHPTPKSASGGRRYVVKYRLKSGQTVTQVCEVTPISEVRWEFQQPTAPENLPDSCLSCGAPFLPETEQCEKCGWTFKPEGGRFVIPEIRRPLPKCRVRPYRESDFEKCAELYRLNEPERFPPGYYDEFCKSLCDGKTMFLVTEEDGTIRGVCGIVLHREPHHIASLCFGLVHPDFHGRGFGTVQLLARVAHLPSDTSEQTGTMTSVLKSAPFYVRFGFNGVLIANERGDEMWELYAQISDADVAKCREVLANAGVVLDTEGAVIPVNSPREAAEEKGN